MLQVFFSLRTILNDRCHWPHKTENLMRTKQYLKADRLASSAHFETPNGVQHDRRGFSFCSCSRWKNSWPMLQPTLTQWSPEGFSKHLSILQGLGLIFGRVCLCMCACACVYVFVCVKEWCVCCMCLFSCLHACMYVRTYAVCALGCLPSWYEGEGLSQGFEMQGNLSHGGGGACHPKGG